jgi:hypothetical protein
VGRDVPAGGHCSLFGVFEFLLDLLEVVLEGLVLRADMMQFFSLVVDGNVLIADLFGELVHLFAQILDFPVLFSN